MNNDDAAAQYFRNVVRQYQDQIGIDTAGYLLQTYQMGMRDVAFTNLVGCLVDLGNDEGQLLAGPLGQFAQMLQVPTTSSAEPDQSAIRVDPSQQPDPFAEVAPMVSQPAAPDWQQYVTQDDAMPKTLPQQNAQQTQALPIPQPPEAQSSQPTLPAPQPSENGTLRVQQ